MAHHIESTDHMAYVGQVPWHGLGTKLEEGATVDEMRTAAHLDWDIERVSLMTVANDQRPSRLIKDKFAMVRSDTGDVLDVIGRSYVPTSVADAFEFFHDFAEAGELTMHTAGSLSDGRWIWCLAKNHATGVVGRSDRLENYVLLVSPNVLGRSLVVKQTSVRVVCWNTMTAALGSAAAEGGVFRMRHLQAFDEGQRQLAAETVNLATSRFNNFVELGNQLSEIKMPLADQMEFLKVMFKLDDASLERRRELDADQPAKRVHTSPMIARFTEALTRAPGALDPTTAGTAWGTLNAVTWMCDHSLGNSVDNRLRESWLGYRENLKLTAVDMLKELLPA